MKANHNPSLQDRLTAAAQSRQKALDKLRSKPPVDEAVLAARREARLKKEAAEEARRAAKAEAAKAAADAKAAAAEEKAAAEARAKAFALPPTAAEMKAARDARYAARKMRK